MLLPKTRSWAALLLAAIPAPIAGADDPRDAAPDVMLTRCSIEYEHMTTVGAISLGANISVLQDCLVRLGERVKADQVLGRLQSRDIVVEMAVRKAEAENLLNVRVAENRHAVAAARYQRSAPLVEKSFVSKLDYQLLELDKEAAALAVEQARYERALALLRYQELQAQARTRDFRSPHDGIVLEIYKHQGEKITATDQVFLVTNVQHLLVVGQLDVADAWRVREGQRVRVVAEVRGADLAIEREAFWGQVTFCDRRIDPANSTCKVVARIENRDELLRSGLEARMEIYADGAGDRPSNPAPAR